MNKIKLHNGVEIPQIGFGTYLGGGNKLKSAILAALKVGYRHIDTAAFYKNEEEVGQAIKESGIDRKDLFITSKVWNTDRGYQKTLDAFNKSLSKLQLDYIDLYLIHWPANEKQYEKEANQINIDTRKALEKLYKEGKVRAIGVSNFFENHIINLLNNCEIKPMIDQIELHPGCFRQDLIRFLQKENIAIEAWSPLGRGKSLKNDVVEEIAKKYNITLAQTCLAFELNQGFIVLPKSLHEERIKENFEAINIKLKQEDIDKLISIDNLKDSKDPDEINF